VAKIYDIKTGLKRETHRYSTVMLEKALAVTSKAIHDLTPASHLPGVAFAIHELLQTKHLLQMQLFDQKYKEIYKQKDY